jgi:hypothetical protein
VLDVYLNTSSRATRTTYEGVIRPNQLGDDHHAAFQDQVPGLVFFVEGDGLREREGMKGGREGRRSVLEGGDVNSGRERRSRKKVT